MRFARLFDALLNADPSLTFNVWTFWGVSGGMLTTIGGEPITTYSGELVTL